MKRDGAEMSSDFIRQAIRAFMEGRSRSAGRYVDNRLSSMDDRTLASLGRSRKALSKVDF
jgi:hypothetical protein